MNADNRWRKSSYSGGQPNNCVELDVRPAHAKIRDTKNQQGGTLTIPSASWCDFLESIK